MAKFFAFTLLVFSIQAIAIQAALAQHSKTIILGEQFLKSSRFKGVKTFSLILLGDQAYPDHGRLEQFAKAEARRLLPGIAYRGYTSDKSPDPQDGSHLLIFMKVDLAWSPDQTRDYVAAFVDTDFNVDVSKAVKKNGLSERTLYDLPRTNARNLVGVPRAGLTAGTEQGITRTLELLADGFFESR